jgi:beta-1,4-N-acetylglucosaminyltransferase
MEFYFAVTLFVFLFIIYKILLILKPFSSNDKIKTLIVLGSGGHTSEMFSILNIPMDRYTPRIYVIGESDFHSERKAKEFEISYGNVQGVDYLIERVPRAREVGQSYVSSVFTVLNSFIYSIYLLGRILPDVLVMNGPGTCIPIFLASLVLFPIKRCKSIYIESFARVKTLSLTGKILYILRCKFVVQWPQLIERYPRAEYHRLVEI